MTYISFKEHSRLTTLIFQAAADPARWTDVLDRIGVLSGGVRTHLFGHCMTTGKGLDYVSANYDPDFLKSWEAHYRHMNAWAPGFAKARPGETLAAEQMCPRDELVRTEFYNDWVKPQEDILAGGGTMLFKDGTRMFVIGGNIRAMDQERLQAPFLDLLRQLTPYLRHALEINRALESAKIEILARTQEAGRAAAVLVVGPRGRVLHANGAAEAMLEEGAAVRRDIRRRLVFTDPSAMTSFRRALNALRAHDREVGAAFAAGSSLAADQYVCRAARFYPDRDGFSPLGLGSLLAEPSILVTISPARRTVRPERHLARAFGFTETEAEVVLALSGGLSPREISERRRVSVHTIRNQLKSAMAKAGVRRQSALVKVVYRQIPR